MMASNTSTMANPAVTELTDMLALSTDTNYLSEVAACVGEDPELFFPHPSETFETARGICAGCPIKQQCFDYASNHGEDGVWGGVRFEAGKAQDDAQR